MAFKGSSASAIGSVVAGGTVGSILFVDANGDLGEDNSNLFWDDSNDRFGIGRSDPNFLLHVDETTNDTQAMKVETNFITPFAATDLITEYYNAGVLRTRLRATGIQDWFINGGSSEKGEIHYTTPSGNPAIIIQNPANDPGSQKTAAMILKGSDFTLGASNSGGADEDMRITGSGQIGMNITDPDATLELGTISSTEEGLHIKGSVSQTGFLMLMTDSSDNIFVTFGDGLTSSEIRFNDQQVDIDFVVEGNDIADMIFGDASTNQLLSDKRPLLRYSLMAA